MKIKSFMGNKLDYRGPVGVVLLNTDFNESFLINPGDRIAQMVLMPHFPMEFMYVNKLEDSQRGANGFGSSGIA